MDDVTDVTTGIRIALRRMAAYADLATEDMESDGNVAHDSRMASAACDLLLAFIDAEGAPSIDSTLDTVIPYNDDLQFDATDHCSVVPALVRLIRGHGD